MKIAIEMHRFSGTISLSEQPVNAIFRARHVFFSIFSSSTSNVRLCDLLDSPKRILKKVKDVFCKFLMRKVINKDGYFYDFESDYAHDSKYDRLHAAGNAAFFSLLSP